MTRTDTAVLPQLADGAASLTEALFEPEPGVRSPWIGRYRLVLLASDICAILVAALAGFELRFGAWGGAGNVDYSLVGVLIAVGWLIALQCTGGYEIRHIATGPEELKRIVRASAITMAVVAITCYATKTPVARGFIIGVIPLGAAFLVATRTAVRRFVNARRRNGSWTFRILAVGTSESVAHLREITERASRAGLHIAAACVEDAPVGSKLSPGIPVVGGIFDAARCAAEIDADVVAVTGSGLGPTAVRELGWALESSNCGLVMAPALTEIAGSRVHVSPVEGLPLVWLEKPQLGRVPRVVKRLVDIAVAAVALLVTAPVLVATAIAVKATSPGPVLFRQRRLGVNGEEFTICKFRSMSADAESRRDELAHLNEQDGGGVLFKIREDPRITPVGRWIRRLSIDELPQLLQVLGGTMSLVGPRPLASVDSLYTGSARRRLLVKPGLTGLWQISGRSETTWDDAVRMDLYYVENWSLGLDLSILVRTVGAVLRSKGAF